MATVNITVSNDADFYQEFKYVTADSEEGAAFPINLTGASMEMMLRRHVEDEAAYLRLATDTGEIEITDALLGQFSILITQATLLQLSLGDYFHSLILTMTERKIKIWSGLFTLNAGATR